MKILLIADGRSPITKNWIESVRSLNSEVILISSYPCKKPDNVQDFYMVPVAFAGYGGNQALAGVSAQGERKSISFKQKMIRRFRPLFMKLRYILGPLSLPIAGWKIRKIVEKTRPDLAHALRIPYEGMAAACLMPEKTPFAVSIWGNDLTLHARGSWLMKKATLRTLRRANGLAADTQRDIRLGRLWGFDSEKQTLVVPGSGGIEFTSLKLSALNNAISYGWVPPDANVVINPRGFRPGSVRNDTFFKSIPLILSRFPNTLFLCCSMANQPEALDWVAKLKIHDQVVLLPTLTQPSLWALYTRANAMVSVSSHDGTPNSLLEAMTLGCFPVVGDIESMREWITPGLNGLLVDPDDPEQLAAAVVAALSDDALRQQAARINARIILEKADISVVSTAIEVFYRQLTGDH